MNTKVTGILSYCSIVGWLVAFFGGDKDGAKFHLNQGLVLGIAEVALSVISTALGWIPILGTIISIACWAGDVFCVVLSILGIVAASKNEQKELPVISGIKILK